MGFASQAQAMLAVKQQQDPPTNGGGENTYLSDIQAAKKKIKARKT